MASFNKEQFHLLNLVSTLDDLGVTVKWVGANGKVDDYLVGELLMTQAKFNDKITLFNAIVDSWFSSKLLEIAIGGGIKEASSINVAKAQATFKMLKQSVKKLLMSTNEMKSYEFYLDKIDDLKERIDGFKVVING